MLELKSEKFDTEKLPYKIQDILLILELLKTGECKFTYPKTTEEELKEIKDKWIPWVFYFSFSKKREAVNRIATRKGYSYLPEFFSVGWLSLPETVKEEKFNLIVEHYKKMIHFTPKVKGTFQKQFPKIQGLFGDSCQVEFDEFLNKLKKELEIE